MARDSWLETKEQVRQAIGIVDLVGSYVQLRRQGHNYVGLCPWHDDRRPSLQINPERGSFKCFVCDIGGDIFSFIMQMEGVEFRNALEMLAERAGIELNPGEAGRPKAEPGSPDDKRTLYQAMAWAESQYHQCLLHASEAASARSYLQERRISPDSIVRFHIGFAPPEWDWLLKRAADTPYSPQVLERVGLVMPRRAQASGGRESPGRAYYDRFRGRVLFSIREAHSREARPIAFGGRILPELAQEQDAKYINSPETPLFSKNRQVYGLDIAREAVISGRSVVVVEGYTDCIAAHQSGVNHVVAVLGTALGERHISLLRRFADRITLVLDGDEAGQRRANEILELFIAAQVDLRILTLPQNLDPCDFVIAHGGEAFGRLLAEAVDALEHKVRTVTKGLDITANTHEANEALEDILGTMARAPRLATTTPDQARVREQQVLSRLAMKFRVPEEHLRGRISDLRRTKSPAAAAPDASEDFVQAGARRLDAWDQHFLELLIIIPEALAEVRTVLGPDDLRSPLGRTIYHRCLDIQEGGEVPNFDRLMLESEDAGMKRLLIRLEEQGRAKAGDDPKARLWDVVNHFRRRKEDTDHQHQISALHEGSSHESDEEAIGNLLASLRTRHRTSDPTEG